RRRAHQARQAHAAAPAGVDAQLDFGQADPGRRVVAGHAVVAGQRDLGAAAHAEAVDRGDRGAGQLGQALERLLAAADGVADRALAVELGELADVGAGDEALVLGRAQHKPLGRIQGQAFEQGLEFDQHVLAEGVDRLAGAIERQHGNAVGALLDLPVAEAQSVQASNHAGPSVRVWVALYDPEGVAPQSNPAPARPGANRLRAL